MQQHLLFLSSSLGLFILALSYPAVPRRALLQHVSLVLCQAPSIAFLRPLGTSRMAVCSWHSFPLQICIDFLAMSAWFGSSYTSRHFFDRPFSHACCWLCPICSLGFATITGLISAGSSFPLLGTFDCWHICGSMPGAWALQRRSLEVGYAHCVNVN